MKTEFKTIRKRYKTLYLAGAYKSNIWTVRVLKANLTTLGVWSIEGKGTALITVS